LQQLIIGDFHAVAEELPECRELAAFILQVVDEHKLEQVLFLGDQYHTHALVNVRVMEFWLWFFREFEKRQVHVIALVGNHDQDGAEESTAHAMLPHQHNITVVDRPSVLGGILHLPYYATEEAFQAGINQCLSSLDPLNTVLICHQTFNGCMYENGFYSETGFNLDAVPFKRVISGHIHRPQNFNKLWYPGSPRWRSISDANTERFIYLVDHQGGDYTIERIDTSPYCRVIHHVEVTPESPEIPDRNEKDLFVLDVKGPAEWLEKMQPRLNGCGHRVRIMRTGGPAISIKESDGIAVSFRKYLDAWVPKYGTDREVLKRMAEVRLGL
jgi:DNA repair exonuclease SbcCD nuclease subunit